MESGWVSDPIYFDATVRRSGNSLVITVPPELARRFLIGEGQAVRLVGSVRRDIQTEGSISVYLGRFICREKVSGLKFTLTNPEIDEELVPNLVSEVARKFSSSEVEVKMRRKGVLECKIYLGSISKDGFTFRSGRELRMMMTELKSSAEAHNFRVEDMEIFEETVTLEGVDPSVINQALRNSPERVKYEWVS